MSQLIVPSFKQPDQDGCVLRITPQSAGWTYVGFEVYQFTKGQKLTKNLGNDEACVVLLSGKIHLKTSKKEWREIGGRITLFEGPPPFSFYVPHKEIINIEALSNVELAICLAPGRESREARIIPPQEVGVEMRGSHTTKRRIHNILPEEKPADSLLVVEVFTPGGHWSSYPPHKHDEDNLPTESYLEETYYHRMNPNHGFVIQRVYTDDRSIDETMTIKNQDAVLVPKGYHPVGAPPGYDSYYLNVMAGPIRTWKFKNDGVHEWLMSRK